MKNLKWPFWLGLLCALVASSLNAQNLRQLTRATATTGVNDSALVLVSDSASRTRAALTLDLFRRPAGTAAAPSYSFGLSTGLGAYRFGADTLGFATGGIHSLRLSGGASPTIAGGAGNTTWISGIGNSRIMTFQATSNVGAVNTFAIGASDTLKLPGKAIFSALTAASGTPNTFCINATTKEGVENAASSCTVSSLRFKRDIAPLNPATAKRIAARLKPVTFTYKDGGREAIGLIAEDAAIADGRLVSRDAQGRPHSVNYEQVTILLLSIVQQQQKRIDSLAARVTALSRRPR